MSDAVQFMVRSGPVSAVLPMEPKDFKEMQLWNIEQGVRSIELKLWAIHKPNPSPDWVLIAFCLVMGFLAGFVFCAYHAAKKKIRR